MNFPIDVTHRYDFHFFFDVVNGNPNGDPDDGNKPRTDPETARGWVSDVSLKRKIRETVPLLSNGRKGCEIHIRARSVLGHDLKSVCEDLGIKSKTDKKAAKKKADADGEETEAAPLDQNKAKEATAEFCRRYYDVRLFGDVPASKEFVLNKVTGPVQINCCSVSVDEVKSSEMGITRCATNNDEQSQTQEGRNQNKGGKHVVPYALYHGFGSFNANEAKRTGVSPEDLGLFWRAMLLMFDNTGSASRGLMSMRKLIVFEHASNLGNAPAAAFYDFFKHEVRRIDENRPARLFSDYRIPSTEEVKKAFEPFKDVTVHDLTPAMAYEADAPAKVVRVRRAAPAEAK